MYEVWYTADSTPSMTYYETLDEAVQAALKLVFDESVVFDYLVGPDQEILNNYVHTEILKEKRRRKNEKDRAEGKSWVVEVKAQHLDDLWAVNSYAPNQESANGRAIELMALLGDERVRIRELLPE